MSLETKRIHKLDPTISNKIAAGEVVERPAAVVKELVENALDAGSKKITIEIRKAGKELIRITDNGSGIEPEDVTLAFERHATSKIQTVDDIYAVKSLGFRGEALASISAVSNMEVTTRRADKESGIRVSLSGGRVLDTSEVGAPVGTTMMVKDLFFNTPARLKFLKTDKAELNAISEIVNKLVLSNPEVGFRYIVDGKNVFVTQGDGKLYSAIYAVFEKSMAKNLIAINCEEQGIKMTGFVSNVQYTRGNRKNQVFFVNGRYIVSPVLMDSMNLAYKPLLSPGRFGACVIQIQLDPSRVDVNIHPAKTEIKFHQEGVIKQILYTKIREVLLSVDQTPSVKLSDDQIFRKVVMEDKQGKQPDHRFVPDAPQTRPASAQTKTTGPVGHVETKTSPGVTIPTGGDRLVRREDRQAEQVERPVQARPMEPKKDMSQPVEGAEKPHEPARPVEGVKDRLESRGNAPVPPAPKKPRPNMQSGRFFGQKKVTEEPVNTYSLDDFLVRETPVEAVPPVEPDHKVIQSTAEIYEDLQPIGALFNTYLIFEKDQKMYMIDQHAAHEKILFEEYMAAFKRGGLDTQVLLTPMMIEVDYATHRFALDNTGSFERFGFRFDDFGQNNLIVREVPVLFDEKGAEGLFRNLLDDLSTKGVLVEMEDKRFNAIATKACKAAVKAHDQLNTIEVTNLLDQLKTLQDPYTCPHGRPIIVSISRGEIERKFKRT